MGGGGDVLLTIGEAGIGGESGPEFDPIAGRIGMDLDGPRSLARVVEKIGAEGVGFLGGLEDGGALVAFGDKLQTIADGTLGEGLAELAVERGGNELGKGIGQIPGFGKCTEKEGGGGETAEGVKFVQNEGGGGGEGEQAGTDFENAKFVGGVLNFTGEDGFQSRATAEVNTEGGSVGQSSIEPNGGGFLLAGEVGFGALFGEVGKLGSLSADEVEGGGTSDLVEGLAKKLFFPVDLRLLQKLEKLTFLGPAGTDLGEGVHGIATNFFRGVLEKGEEPLANGFLESGLMGFRKAGADGADDGNKTHSGFGGGLVEAGDLLLPKLRPRERAEFPIKVFGRVGLLFGHERGSV